MNTESRPKIISKIFPIDATSILLEMILMVILGFSAVLLRTYLRIPIGIPGHHGIEVMAILIMGRTITRLPFSASLAGFSASMLILMPFFGYKDPFLPLIYFIMGVGIDVLFSFWKEKRSMFFFMALLGGLIYTLIPVSRMIIHFTTGFPYKSFIKHGYLLTIMSHALFGVIGALAGYSITKTIRQYKK